MDGERERERERENEKKRRNVFGKERVKEKCKIVCERETKGTLISL